MVEASDTGHGQPGWEAPGNNPLHPLLRVSRGVSVVPIPRAGRVERRVLGAPRVSQRVELTDHARRQAARRGISELAVLGVACAPEQIVQVRPGREVRQSRIIDEKGAPCLIRVVTDRMGQDIRVVTVYRTSKVGKYWSPTS